MKAKTIQKDLESNKKEIENLQKFRQTKQVKLLIRHLFVEQSFLIQKLYKLRRKKSTSPEKRQEITNPNRREKMPKCINLCVKMGLKTILWLLLLIN